MVVPHEPLLLLALNGTKATTAACYATKNLLHPKDFHMSTNLRF